jgi:prepilin-type processing-associated H-X9-DG protein
MKQIGLGIMQYTQDFDEKLPGTVGDSQGQGLAQGFLDPMAGRNWAASIQPYIKNYQVFACPSATPRGGGGAYSEIQAPGVNLSYYLNGVVGDKALAVIQEPATIIFLHEWNFYGRAATNRPRLKTVGTKTFTEFDSNQYDYLHNEGAVLLFTDGHAKWRRRDNIRYADFGTNAPPEKTFPGGGLASSPRAEFDSIY